MKINQDCFLFIHNNDKPDKSIRIPSTVPDASREMKEISGCIGYSSNNFNGFIQSICDLTVCLMTFSSQNLRRMDLILMAFAYCIATLIDVIIG